MDEQEYIDYQLVKNNPNYCPVCNSDDFRQDDSAYDDVYHWMYLRCMDCDSQWTEQYKLDKVWITVRHEPAQDLDEDEDE